MTLEEMQSILSHILQLQQQQQENHLQNQQEMTELQRQEQERHLQHQLEMDELQKRHLEHQLEMDKLQRQQREYHLQHELEMAQLRENLAKTEAIANSNARAIEASTNAGAETRQDLARLVNIVADITQATNRRLELLESK